MAILILNVVFHCRKNIPRDLVGLILSFFIIHFPILDYEFDRSLATENCHGDGLLCC